MDNPIIDVKLLPDEDVIEHPIVQQLSREMSITDFKIPFILRGKTLMEEGTWNNHFYSAASIKSAFESTDWSDRNKRDLFLDHEDLKASDWIGNIENMRFDGKKLLGDLIIHDLQTAIKLQSGRPKVGISPKVKGKSNIHTKEMASFYFDNFSVVMNPAVKTAYINNSEERKMAYSEKKAESESQNKKKPSFIEEDTVPESDYMKDKDSRSSGSVAGEGIDTNTHMAELEEFRTYADNFIRQHRGATIEDAVKAYRGREAVGNPDAGTPRHTERYSDGSLADLRSEIKALKSELSSIRAPKAENSDFTALESKLSSMQASFDNISKLVATNNIPDRRSVNSAPISENANSMKAKLQEIEADTDKAFAKFLREEFIDGGASA